MHIYVLIMYILYVYIYNYIFHVHTWGIRSLLPHVLSGMHPKVMVEFAGRFPWTFWDFHHRWCPPCYSGIVFTIGSAMQI